MMKITEINAREILDSRGNPTVETKVIIDDLYEGVASVPSGASKGEKEALELRDEDNRYHGKGVQKAISNILNVIKPNVIGKEFANNEELDKVLKDLDGTENKRVLGANSILSVSIAFLKACCVKKQSQIYEYLGNNNKAPYMMMNIINGGQHADNNLLFQEFMIVPTADQAKERVRIGCEVFQSLKKILKENHFSTNVGDEGGFAPNVNSEEEALEFIISAIKDANYEPGKDVNIALDVAASSFYDDQTQTYKYNNQNLTSEEMINIYSTLVAKYPIISIEDPLDENDWSGFKKITEKLGNKILIVGDDLFVTNKQLLQQGINNQCCNAILIKPNQIGTVSETIETIKLAQQNKYKIIVSHRSGETSDTFISDLSVGMNAEFIKAGSLSRGERVAKYNRLTQIEE